jgi:hypothetical protein
MKDEEIGRWKTTKSYDVDPQSHEIIERKDPI